MRLRSLAVCALVLVACGGPGSVLSGPPSAQTVAAKDSDWPGLKRCPESGSYDHFLQAEKAKASDQYATDKKTWDDLKAGGADDGNVAVYAEQSSQCGAFGAGTPGASAGKIAYVYAIRFKDASSAASSFKTSSKDFHLSDTELTQLKAAGATVDTGAATGLGDNAVDLSIEAEGISLFVAFWERKTFEVAMVTFNEGSASKQAATSINSRIS